MKGVSRVRMVTPYALPTTDSASRLARTVPRPYGSCRARGIGRKLETGWQGLKRSLCYSLGEVRRWNKPTHYLSKVLGEADGSAVLEIGPDDLETHWQA